MTKSFKRVLIVGPTSSGKTTLAEKISEVSGLPHIELDLLRYKRDWQEVPIAEFHERVAAVVQTSYWIIDGNYSAVREMTWKRADLVLWLDYSLAVVLYRLLIRTVRRLVTMTDVGNENREQLRRLFGRRSIISWAVRSHSPLRKEYEIAIAALPSHIPHIVRHRSPRETQEWLSKLRHAVPDACDTSREGVLGITWAMEGR
jgi:adenylate kinase family enzyme